MLFRSLLMNKQEYQELLDKYPPLAKKLIEACGEPLLVLEDCEKCGIVEALGLKVSENTRKICADILQVNQEDVVTLLTEEQNKE